MRSLNKIRSYNECWVNFLHQENWYFRNIWLLNCEAAAENVLPKKVLQLSGMGWVIQLVRWFLQNSKASLASYCVLIQNSGYAEGCYTCFSGFDEIAIADTGRWASFVKTHTKFSQDRFLATEIKCKLMWDCGNTRTRRVSPMSDLFW